MFLGSVGRGRVAGGPLIASGDPGSVCRGVIGVGLAGICVVLIAAGVAGVMGGVRLLVGRG
jgi:hypothetical protein